MSEPEWSPPVEADSFEEYTFEAKPFGVFPRYPIACIGIDGNAIDEPMRMRNQEYNPNSEVKPDERED